MKKKKIYILIVIIIILLLIIATVKYEEGVTVGAWGRNRTISWGWWNFGF